MTSRARLSCVLALLAMTMSLSGCLARQVTRDSVNARRALLDMYTDQVMDNLIRAHDNLPFVQVAYSDVTVQDNDQFGSTLMGNWPGTMWGASGNASRSRTLSVVANPIVDQNDVYDAYVTFANDSGLFVVTCEDPGAAAHICRKQNGVYYWVPTEAGRLFLELALTTTFKRGPESVPPGAYEVKIAGVTEVIKTNPMNPVTKKLRIPNAPADLQNAVLTFDNPVPSGDATLVAKLTDGRTIRIMLYEIPTKKNDDSTIVDIIAGSPTSALKTQSWSPQIKGYTENDLMGAKARLYSHDFPADAPVPSAPLQRINSNLNFLRNVQSQTRRIP